MLVVATGLAQAANDKQQITPMVETLGALPEELGEVGELLADAGYFSEANVVSCVEAGIDPLIATGRESHHLPWQERFSEPPLLAMIDMKPVTLDFIRIGFFTRVRSTRFG